MEESLAIKEFNKDRFRHGASRLDVCSSYAARQAELIDEDLIIIFTDLHAHNYHLFNSTSESGISDRVLLQKEIFDFVAGIRSASNVQSIFLGDLFHLKNHIDVSVFNRVLQGVDYTIHNHLIMLAGNHDQYNASGSIVTFDSINPVFKINGMRSIEKVINARIIDTHVGIKVGCIPYCSTEDKFKASLALIMMDNPDILCIHQVINDVITPYHVFKSNLDVSIFPKDIPVFSGHIHVPQVIGNVHYPGAVMPQSFSDEGVPGSYLIYHCRTKQIDVAYLNVPRFYTIQVDDIDVFKSELELKCDEKDYVPWDCFRVRYSNEKHLPEISKMMRSYDLNNVQYQYSSKSDIKASMNRTFSQGPKITEQRMIDEYVNGNSTSLNKAKLKNIGIDIVKKSKVQND